MLFERSGVWSSDLRALLDNYGITLKNKTKPLSAASSIADEPPTNERDKVLEIHSTRSDVYHDLVPYSSQ